MTDLLKDLNDRQREAVTAPLGPVLVLAGAGSGKTRVLTYRIAYLLSKERSRPFPTFKPHEILALTFTNKAAGEMRGRIVGLIGKSTPTLSPPISRSETGGDEEGVLQLPIVMGTFHSVCARILRKEIENLPPLNLPLSVRPRRTRQGEKERGYSRNFVIYDTDDSLRVLKQIVLELGLQERFRPQVFAYYISKAKNRLVRPADLALDNDFFRETLQEVYEIYQKRLREHNAADFDDLLILVFELLDKHPVLRKKYQERFRYVLVDEYQDTNHAQYMILKHLVSGHRNLFVVGDDAQSIYGFRGANMQNILDFGEDYPQAKIVMLEQNYRSTQAVLDVAHRVIALNPFQYEKKLWTENGRGEKVNLYEARDERDEAEFVLNVIASPLKADEAIPRGSPRPPYQVRGPRDDAVSYTPILDSYMKRTRQMQHSVPIYRPVLSHAERPINGQATLDLSDTVILYRTHAQSRAFEEVLVGSGIPYQIVGGLKFYERKEIKDALAYLRLTLNPRDLVSLSRVINEPARGVGPVAFRELSAALVKHDYNFGRLLNNLDKLELTDKAAAGAKEFFSLYTPPLSPPIRSATGGRTGGEEGGVNILDLMEFILKRSGYKDALLALGEEGQVRWENIEELFNVAGKYSAKGGSASGGKRIPWQEGVQAFLEEVALMTDLDRVEEGGNKLTLMTLHSAKGLEFAKVFLVGVEEGLLPHSRSLLNPQELAEEIRLAYVGITRAKEDLYLSYARQRQSYGELKRCVPSRIIKAIPKRLLRKL